MKLKLLNIITILGLFACSTTNIAYNPKEFDTANYQKNVEIAVDAADILDDFDDIKAPAANLEPADFSSLMQADIYFNQGDYVKSYNYYGQLALKYKDPRIIYKAIVCLEHLSSTQKQIEALDSMINLFIKVAPDSQLAKLFQIKVALKHNNVTVAEANLDSLMDKKPQNGRAILLFISSLLTVYLPKANSDTLTEFGDYLVDNYAVYPEANLASAISYAAGRDLPSLANRLRLIQKKFPNWDVPAIWSIGLLLPIESEAIPLLRANLDNNPQPAPTLQNMYIRSLIKTKELAAAKSYTNYSIQNNLNKENALINLGILQILENNYTAALANFIVAKPTDDAQASIIKLVIASIYDFQGKFEPAIKYYQEAASLNPYLRTPVNLMILNAYAVLGDKIKTNQILYNFATANKLDAKKTIILKAGFYIDVSWYSDAYKLLTDHYRQYVTDRDYIHTYAVAATMTHHISQAIKLYKKYITMDPQNAIGYNDLAFIYAEHTSDYKQSYFYANKAFELNPTDVNILDTLGWVYYKQGNYPMALKYVKSSLEQNYNPTVAAHLRAIYTALKQPDMAAKVVMITKAQMQANIKRQLVDKAITLLMYVQFGVEK